MAAHNSIELTIPLTLTGGTTVQPLHCRLSADSLEGYTTDIIKTSDELILDFTISSGSQSNQLVRRVYRVTHAHPESYNGQASTWFMAIPPGAEG